MRDYRLLENKIGYSFKAPSHLILALTHPSYHEKHNQRMEFLGDAVLELCISRFLYDTEPPLQEGEMTRMRASLVCENTLYHIALQLELGKFILMVQKKPGGCLRQGINIIGQSDFVQLSNHIGMTDEKTQTNGRHP